MSTKMLYRIHGEPERGVMAVVLDGFSVEAKIFQRGEKPEGWVSAGRLLQFLRDEIKDEPESAANEVKIVPITEDDPDYAAVSLAGSIISIREQINGLDDKEAKLKVDQLAAERGIKLDRRKSLSVMLETLEKALANG